MARPRDPRAARWRLRTVVETHVHNDYLTGRSSLAASERARLVAPARGRYGIDHQGADEGDEIEVAGIALRARATPGHTPEHLAWEVHDASAGDGPPGAVLTGARCSSGASAARTCWARTPPTTSPLGNSLRSARWLPCPTRSKSGRPMARAASARQGRCRTPPPPPSAPSAGRTRCSRSAKSLRSTISCRGLHALPDVLPRDGGAEGLDRRCSANARPWRRWIRRPSPRRSPPARRSWTPARVPPSQPGTSGLPDGRAA